MRRDECKQGTRGHGCVPPAYSLRARPPAALFDALPLDSEGLTLQGTAIPSMDVFMGTLPGHLVTLAGCVWVGVLVEQTTQVRWLQTNSWGIYASE